MRCAFIDTNPTDELLSVHYCNSRTLLLTPKKAPGLFAALRITSEPVLGSINARNPVFLAL
jgi:hypothetical protein